MPDDLNLNRPQPEPTDPGNLIPGPPLPPEPPPVEPNLNPAPLPSGGSSPEPPLIITTPPSKNFPPLKKILASIAVFLLLVSIPVAVFLVKQRQEIREKAVGEGQLVCMPIDDAGNLTNEKYQYNRIKVINNTNSQAAIWVQENLCPYQGQPPSPGYQCNQYANRYPNRLSAGQSKIYSIDIPNCQIGQLDIAQDDEAVGPGPDCYNTVDQRIWEGGIAFTIKANSNCAVPQCRQIKAYDTNWNALSASQLSQLRPGDRVRFATLGQPAGEFTKARFRVNTTTWLPETTTKKPNTDEFYLEYSIPTSVTNFRIEAEVYHRDQGWK